MVKGVQEAPLVASNQRCEKARTIPVTSTRRMKRGAEEPDRPPPPPKTDPRLPLTAMQIFKLKNNWKGVSRAMENTGVDMFIRLFQSTEVKAQFPQFRDIDCAELLNHYELLSTHSNLVMESFDSVISNIDEVDDILQTLDQIGSAHAQRTGFEPDHFYKIEQPFLEAVSVTLGDRYSDNMDTIYRVVIKFMLDRMVRSAETQRSGGGTNT